MKNWTLLVADMASLTSSLEEGCDLTGEDERRQWDIQTLHQALRLWSEIMVHPQRELILRGSGDFRKAFAECVKHVGLGL